MAYKEVKQIQVRCWGHEVGALALNPRDNFYAFEYYPEFRKTGIELAPLLAPLSEAAPRTFRNYPEETYYRLPPFIADSLPDAFGNSLIDAWMSMQGIAKSAFTPLDRLAYIGKRGMGALEYHPAFRESKEARSSAIEIRDLVDSARKAVSVNLRDAKAHEIDAELAQLIQVGTSAGGARAKAVVGWNAHTEEFVSGQFDIPPGFEHWLIKFDTEPTGSQEEKHEYSRIEYAYYLMALACGITMSPSRLYEIQGRAHFMTKRYDREEGGIKHHTQTLCALTGMDYNALYVHDYTQIFSAISELGLPYASFDQAFLRMVFNVAASNNDDHTKNHSFLLKEGGSWELAPAYDITYAHNSSDSAWTKKHIMGVSGVFEDISREDVLRAASYFPVENPSGSIDSLLDTLKSWSEFADKAGLSTREKDRVGAEISKCCERLR